MFVVYESGKKADKKSFPYLNNKTWDNCSFSTMEKAIGYAEEWLGEYKEVLPENWDGSKVNYSGYGDTIEIREE